MRRHLECMLSPSARPPAHRSSSLLFRQLRQRHSHGLRRLVNWRSRATAPTSAVPAGLQSTWRSHRSTCWTLRARLCSRVTSRPRWQRLQRRLWLTQPARQTSMVAASWSGSGRLVGARRASRRLSHSTCSHAPLPLAEDGVPSTNEGFRRSSAAARR